VRLSSLAEPILAGRGRELDELLLSLDSIRKGRGSTILVAGEAGSGKTRLAREFLDIAKAQNVIVLSGWCLSNAAIPYFPFIEALESYTENEDNNLTSNSQLMSVKNRLSGSSTTGNISTGSLTPQTWKDQTYSLVTRELLGISTEHPLVLFIDDLHWADSASLSLLHYLARSILSERILILATYRSEEVENFPDGQTNQLKNALYLMARDGLFSEIRLQSLNQNDITEIVESMLEGKAHATLIDRLTKDSQGLPLFVVESTRALFEQQKIKKEDEFWKLTVEDFIVPTKVKDIIHRRIDQLKPTQRRILDVAAVIGEKFDPKLVSIVVCQDSIDVLESLNALEKSTLLVHRDDDYYRFNHAKYREMLYQDIPALLKREYHRRIAQRIEESTKISELLPVNDLAYHYTNSGDKEKSIKYDLLAGHLALNRFSNNEAIRYFMHALDLGASDPSTKVAGTEGLGEAYFASGLFGEALKIFETLGDSAQGAAKLKAYRRAMDSAFFKGEFAKLLELTKKAQEYSAFDRLENARVLMNRARAVMFLGNSKAGYSDFEAALKVFEEENSIPDIARVLLGLGGARKHQLILERGLANELRSILYFQELGDLRGLADAYNRAGQSFGYRFLYDEALKMNQHSIQIGEKIGHYSRVAEAYASMSLVYEATSQINEALTANLKALEFANKAGSQWTLAIAYSNFVLLYSMLEDLEHTERYYSLLSEMPKEVVSNTFVRIGACKTVLSIAKKHYRQAAGLMQESLSVLEEGINPSQEVAVYRNYAQVLQKLGMFDEAEEQLIKAQKLERRVKRVFEHSNVYSFFLAPRKLNLDQKFKVRLDLFNVSVKEANITGIQGLTPKGLKILNMSESCSLENGCIVVYPKTLQPFAGITITIEFQPEKAGLFTFLPQIRYLDDMKRTKKFDLAPHTLGVNTSSLDQGENISPTIEFRSQASRSTFDYLIHSFTEDSTRRKVPLESAGWRTLMDIVKNTKVTKYSLYEFSRSKGKPLSELERMGLVESKYFIGERGRGGRIIKIRVAYDNQVVKAHLTSLNRSFSEK
jgi:tetratricopeptide (TPR) repeat protein